MSIRLRFTYTLFAYLACQFCYTFFSRSIVHVFDTLNAIHACLTMEKVWFNAFTVVHGDGHNGILTLHPGGTLYYEMCHALPKISQFFKPAIALTQWPWFMRFHPQNPSLSSVTQRPPGQFLICHPIWKTSNFEPDFVTPKSIILIIWPKLWLVHMITEARIWRDL